ncbi:hypothetical protein [Pseudanabaena sp. PCC 6802]|uniref:hypothetical protein n=1 Tax=Pseudanabaena sp. PCC 6802 TaxID=118173 RepID=UPI00034A92A6|nr:hypothetical protein [Pseudanabaena sp. PCC 6802]
MNAEIIRALTPIAFVIAGAVIGIASIALPNLDPATRAIGAGVASNSLAAAAGLASPGKEKGAVGSRKSDIQQS